MFLVSNNKSNTFFTNTTIVNGKVFETYSQHNKTESKESTTRHRNKQQP